MRKFKHPDQQAVYLQWVNSPPERVDRVKRYLGSNRDQAFKAGLIGYRCLWSRTTLLYAVYVAGQDWEKENKMKDIFGNKTPIQIEDGEWWFNGRIIQRTDHPKLSKYVSFDDIDGPNRAAPHSSKAEAIKHCLDNPCREPAHLLKDYL